MAGAAAEVDALRAVAVPVGILATAATAGIIAAALIMALPEVAAPPAAAGCPSPAAVLHIRVVVAAEVLAFLA